MTRFARMTAAALAFVLPFVAARPAQAALETTVTVSAQDSVHLAGPITFALLNPLPPVLATIIPKGPLNLWHDAYRHGTFPTEVDLTGFGPKLDISAVGTWNVNTVGSTVSDADGNGQMVTTNPLYTLFGVSALTAERNTLVGVFTTDFGPIPLSAPSGLSILTDDMTSPLLNQAFAIGSLLEGINIPVGATKLWLGIQQDKEWNHGRGTLEVTVQSVPEPASLAVWSILGVGLAWTQRKKLARTPEPVV